MPDTDTVFDTETRTGGGSQDVLAVRTPLTKCRVTSLDCGDLEKALFEVVNVHFTSQVSKASDNDESTMRGEKNSVSWTKIEVVDCLGALVENGRLCRHVSIDDAKLAGVRGPVDIVDRTLFVYEVVSTNSKVMSEYHLPRSILASKPPAALRMYMLVSP